MKPLILITNDDGVNARGLSVLIDIACKYGEVVVMAPEQNASGKSHSITTTRPLRVEEVKRDNDITVYSCDGTPVDCVKLAFEYFCPRPPDLVLSGINHGSNSSINVLYSGTMGAVVEASALGVKAIGFSLLNHNPMADFLDAIPYVSYITEVILNNNLPTDISLNVNIPRSDRDKIKGVRICHEAKAIWRDSYEKRVDPQGRPYWWLTGKFVCQDESESSDEWALRNGYVSIVPVGWNNTHYHSMKELERLFV